jgi:thioredoxin reductase (NADPH)
MDLREFPRSVEDIEAEGPVRSDDVPAISPELMLTAVTHEGHAAGARVVDDAEASADD